MTIFSSIVTAVRLGRRIFDNIRKTVIFIVAAHIPIAGLSLIPVMLGWPLILLPIHIVFFELMVDPVCSVAFENEPEETDVMTRPPRPTNARIFDKSILWLGVRQGLALLAWVIFIYGFSRKHGFDTEQARTLTFTAMIAGDIWLILVNRSWSRSLLESLKQKNTILWSVLAITVSVLMAGIFLHPVQKLFISARLTGHIQYLLSVPPSVLPDCCRQSVFSGKKKCRHPRMKYAIRAGNRTVRKRSGRFHTLPIKVWNPSAFSQNLYSTPNSPA